MILSLTRELSPSHLYLYLYLSLSLSLCRCMLCSTTVLYIGLLLRFLSAKQMKESFLCFLRCPAITHMHSLDLITMHPFSSLPSFPLPLSLSPLSSLLSEIRIFQPQAQGQHLLSPFCLEFTSTVSLQFPLSIQKNIIAQILPPLLLFLSLWYVTNGHNTASFLMSTPFIIPSYISLHY